MPSRRVKVALVITICLLILLLLGFVYYDGSQNMPAIDFLCYLTGTIFGLWLLGYCLNYHLERFDNQRTELLRIEIPAN